MVGVMMKFPRKPDGTLDFKAFSFLSPDLQKAAFLDLKTNGTVEERQAFQLWRAEAQRKQAEAATLKAQMVEMEKQMEEIRLREAALTNHLTVEVRHHVGEAFKNSIPSASLPSSSSSTEHKIQPLKH